MEIIKDGKSSWYSEIRNIFGECENTLDELASKRIFGINFDERENKFIIHEKCDDYFGTELTLDMCKDLAEVFSKMAKKIEEGSNE